MQTDAECVKMIHQINNLLQAACSFVELGMYDRAASIVQDTAAAMVVFEERLKLLAKGSPDPEVGES